MVQSFMFNSCRLFHRRNIYQLQFYVYEYEIASLLVHRSYLLGSSISSEVVNNPGNCALSLGCISPSSHCRHFLYVWAQLILMFAVRMNLCYILCLLMHCGKAFGFQIPLTSATDLLIQLYSCI